LALLGLAHRLTGFTVALWLLLLGATGSLLALQEDWLPLMQPAIAGPPPGSEAQSPAALARRVQAAEAGFGKDRVWALVLAGPSNALDQIYLRDQAGGGFLDPRSGAVIARWAGNERFVDVLFELHRSLLLGQGAKKAVGIVGLVGLAMVLSGLVLAWPAIRRWRGAVWPRSTARSALVVAHRELGLLVALPLLVTMTTGVAVVFPATTKALLRSVSGLPAPSASISKPVYASAEIDWPAVFATALGRFPDASPRVVVWPPAPGSPLAVWLRQSAEWHPNGRTTVHATAAGAVIETHDAVAVPVVDRLVNEAYAVHAGKIGGPIYRSVLALTGLCLALLASYGALAYARRLRGRR
jgi:uncharacterized iron-regulated membrane protein